MDIGKILLTENECYKYGQTIKPIGIVVHSTGAPNTELRRYIAPDDGIIGKNQYNNHWNQFRPSGRQVCVHGFIGTDKNGVIRAYQTLPWTMRGWHAGSGSKGSANDGYLSFEICEDTLNSKTYAVNTYNMAVDLCAYLKKLYSAIKYENIIGHNEAAAKGIASNHGDPEHWWRKFGLSMAQFRKDVKKKVEDNMADKTRFPDVPRSHWAYDHIENLAEAGLIKGYADGTFRPDEAITRAQVCKIVDLAIQLGKK